MLFEIHDIPRLTAVPPDAALLALRREEVAVVVQDMNLIR